MLRLNRMLQTTQAFLACRDCGQIHVLPDRLPTGRWLLCRRCGRRLWRSPTGTLDRPLAYAAAALILFGIRATGRSLETTVGGGRSGAGAAADPA